MDWSHRTHWPSRFSRFKWKNGSYRSSRYCNKHRSNWANRAFRRNGIHRAYGGG